MISCSKNTSEEIIVEPKITIENGHFNYRIGLGPFVFFDDNILKENLLNNFNININKDNEISYTEASNFSGTIDVSFKKITSLTGIEKFTNIIALSFSNNNIVTVDLSQNINLEYLHCSVNKFKEIDLSKNTKLKILEITNTKISKLDLSRNPNLIRVIGQCNYDLKSINFNNNNNTICGIFYFEMNNFSLECIQVDHINNAKNNKGWLVPANTNYSTNCFKKNNIF